MLTVLKLGGSVLRDDRGFQRAATFIAERLGSDASERLVVVVSAQHGATDCLLEEATTITPDPDRTALDLLWSTGELRSVARLALYLQRLDVRAEPLNVHQAGLLWDEERTTVRPLRLLAALANTRVVIVPGFLAVRPGGAVRSLGRGGSDLTAILLAAALGAEGGCELVKDVAGYHTADPHVHPDAQPITSLSIVEALVMAQGGCNLVQHTALEAARTRDLRVIVRSLDRRAPVTELYPELLAAEPAV
jgi:aspartate kinase